MPRKYLTGRSAGEALASAISGMKKKGPKIGSKVAIKKPIDPNANRMTKGSKEMNKPNGIKQIGDMIKNAARNPADYYAKNAPIKKGRTAGPAERVGRKYGTKAGRAIDRGVNAVTRTAQNAAIRVKGRAMDFHGDMSNQKYSGYDMAKAAGVGAVGYGIGNYAGSKWSEHKRQQRGY